MWNKDKSLTLSKVFAVILAVALAVLLASGPWVIGGLMRYSYRLDLRHYNLFLASYYSGGLVAAALVYNLLKLLFNLGRAEVFVGANVTYLRRISWSCFAGAAICLLSAFYYLPWAFIAAAAVFMGLIIRVIKNVFEQAISIKEDSDYTI